MNRRDFIKRGAVAATSVVLASWVTAEKIMDDVESPDGVTTKKSGKMKIVVLTGSPRKSGNTNYLADRFIAGAKENGHDVFKFDCASHKVSGCIACNRCGMDGDCIFNDDFDIVRPKIIEADMVVFVTPMYYFGFSSQLKSVIDRFYALNGTIKGASKKTAFMMAYADTAEKEAQAMLLHYHTLADYLGWKDMGTVVAPGVWTAGSIKNTKYGDEAYNLGKKI